MSTAVALLSGSLDSRLAIRLVQEQGITVSAVYCEALCRAGPDRAVRAALELGVPLEILQPGDDYLEILLHPAHGYGRGANPCLDCRITMFRRAGEIMDRRGTSLVVSGEVLGQHPMTQKRRDLLLVAQASGLGDRLLRPLSAQRLTPSRPEREGLVDRTRLHGFSGRGRKAQLELARALGLQHSDDAPMGCALAEQSMAAKVRNLLRHNLRPTLWDFELLRLGRHISIEPGTLLVLGRNDEENVEVRRHFERPDGSATALVTAENFPGPSALLVGSAGAAALEFAQQQITRYGKPPAGDGARFQIATRSVVG